MDHNPYHCQECGGTGEEECVHCGSTVECECCEGSGYDPDLLDLAAFLAAEQKLLRKHRRVSEWIKNGVYVGRIAEDGSRIAYRDFLLPHVTPPFEDDSRSLLIDPAQASLFQ